MAWDMIEQRRIAAYGDKQDVADRLNLHDVVFYSQTTDLSLRLG